MLKNLFTIIWVEAQENNIKNIISLIKRKPNSQILDIGCGDGQQTVLYKNKIGSRKIVGADVIKEKLAVAKERGVTPVVANFEKKWPFPDNSFDVIVSNQVIEHMHDIDNFLSESYRILKPGGYSITSTENLSSWHNIFALIMGFQDFSHHLIRKAHVGNPIAIHNNKQTCSWSGEGNSGIDEIGFPHVKIPTFISVRKIFEAYNFEYIEGKGSGYYPLFGRIGSFVSKIDPYHSHFITIKCRKPKK
jgi:ubiquinone/menaquinone biosynthesis C-methylase UbiE